MNIAKSFKPTFITCMFCFCFGDPNKRLLSSVHRTSLLSDCTIDCTVLHYLSAKELTTLSNLWSKDNTALMRLPYDLEWIFRVHRGCFKAPSPHVSTAIKVRLTSLLTNPGDFSQCTPKMNSGPLSAHFHDCLAKFQFCSFHLLC